MTCAPSEDSDQPRHPPVRSESLKHKRKHWNVKILKWNKILMVIICCDSFFFAHQTRFSAIFTSADTSYFTYPYPTHGIDNQKTSDPVNAHLTPGPGIYFNAFIHVYSPLAGADNLLETNVAFNRKPLSLCPFVLKKSLWSMILNAF